MTEEWKPISGYEGFYEVSNLGNIRSVDRYVRSGNGSLRKIPSRPVAQVVTHGYRLFACPERTSRNVSEYTKLYVLSLMGSERRMRS